MSAPISQEPSLDPKQRALEKQISRERDEQALASGKTSREQLRRQNAPFAQLRVRPNFAAVVARL